MSDMMEMTLDDLLGLNDEDLSNTADDVDLSQYGEEDEKVDYPHFKVSTKKFIEALRISNVVSQGSGRDVISKAVAMEVKGGDLQIYLTDFDIFVEKSLEVINTDNILNDFIAVNLTIISKLVKACPSVLTIYKKDNKYYIKLIGGDMELETINIEEDQIRLKDRDKFVKEGELVTTEFYKTIKSLFVLANAGVTPAQRRVFYDGDSAYSVFLYCLAKYNNSKITPKMDIKIKDIKILYSLASNCEDTELMVYKLKNRILIEGSNFRYSFLLSDNKPPQQMIDGIDKIFVNEPIYIDYNQLVKITDVSSDLMYSINRLDFNYTEEGTVECIMRTKRSDSVFSLRGTPNPNLKPLEKHVSVQSSLLKVLLKVFNSESTIGLVISKEGIGLKSDKYIAVLYTEGE